LPSLVMLSASAVSALEEAFRATRLLQSPDTQ
jgi:hypothetical protein